VEEAVRALQEAFPFCPETERVPLLETDGRICGEDIHACLDQPPFARSPLDGYAVRHEDLAGASREHPAALNLLGTVYAGDSPQMTVRPGEAVRIMTGAPIPEGADCVVRQEDTEQADMEKESGQVRIFVQLKKYQNYCFRGEDIHAGQPMVHKGEKLAPGFVGLLASQGIAEVPVFKKPGLAVISTGSELVSPGQRLEPGKIYDSNRMMLAAYGAQKGARITLSAHVPDDPEQIAKVLSKALAVSDLVVTTGGVSVGRHDYMEKAGQTAGARVLFHGVKVKPGSPVLVLEKDGKLVICLSGNPFASFATFVLLVLPVLSRLQGSSRLAVPERTGGFLKDSFSKASPGRRFVRAMVKDGQVYLPEGHASGMIASLAHCNCMIDVPAGNQGLKAGEWVDVVLF